MLQCEPGRDQRDRSKCLSLFLSLSFRATTGVWRCTVDVLDYDEGRKNQVMSKMPISSVPPSASNAPHDRSRQLSLLPAHRPGTRSDLAAHNPAPRVPQEIAHREAARSESDGTYK